MGWVMCIADTAYDWIFTKKLNNVHVEHDGDFSEEIYDIYEQLATGGVGCIISGVTSVTDDDYYFGGMARLSNDGLIPEHKRLTDIAHAHGFFLSRFISPPYNQRSDRYGGPVEQEYSDEYEYLSKGLTS